MPRTARRFPHLGSAWARARPRDLSPKLPWPKRIAGLRGLVSCLQGHEADLACRQQKNEVQTETPGTPSQDEPQIKNAELACVREHNKSRADIALPQGLAGRLMSDIDAKGASRSLKPDRRRHLSYRPLQVKMVLIVWSPPSSTNGRVESAVEARLCDHVSASPPRYCPCPWQRHGTPRATTTESLE